MEKEPTGIVNVPVDVVDTENEKLLQRDSAMEMEMLELFEDITLEDVVLNKACVGKVMGCKDMPASVVKKILMGIWRNVGSWRMKKCGEGVLGFFFDTEEDCKFIMDKRPWLVNGMLLNLKPWPVEGEVRVADFEVARFWVQFHGLPTRCLSNKNAIIIAKKAGQFVKSDDKSKVDLVRRGYLRCWLDVWIAHPFVVGFFLKAEGREETCIQFKYEKLPFLCFNCGKLAHLDRVCHVPTAMVFPKNGEAVQMYGPWVKSESGRSNCFSMAGKGITRSLIEPTENALIDRKTEKKGTWRRRHSRKSVGEDDSTLACKKDSEAVSAMSRGVEASSSEKDRDRASDSSTNSQKVVFDRMVGNFGYVRDPIPIGPNYLDLPNPDFANVGEGKIPDIGPTLAQSLEIPHSWVCASQRPHNYPDEVPIKWPTNDLEMQKAFLALYGREVTNKFEAQQTLIANPPDLSELINHLLGTHKRKAQTWYIPVPSHPHCSIGKSDILIENETPPSTEIEKQLSVDTEASFSMGSFEQGDSSKKFWARRGGGRKHAPTSPMRCLSWNCRGLRRPSAERTLRSLIRETDADFIFLSETKVSADSMINIINILGFLNICCIPAVGLAGGMCIAWRRIQINVFETFDSGFKVNVLDMPGCASWVLFCIYGLPYGDLKQSFWDRMLSKVHGSPLPWALMGDLNLILEAKEKMGGRPFQVNEGNMLKEFLLGSGGIDLGYVGPPCTWQNARTAMHHIRKRLDRVIADSQWCLLFPNASVCHLPIYGSDHAPFCLNVWGINEKLCYPFRFLEVWTSSKECGEVIDRAWAQHIPVWHSNRFQRKLQITKQELKCWNLNKFGFVDRRLKDLKHSLGLIQGAPVTQSLLENEAGIQLEILELEAKMEKIWKQKSRENWLKYGDNNTKFFHASTVVRRRKNRVSCIETSPNVWIPSRHDIDQYFQDKFQELYQSTNPVINEDLDALFTIKVSPEENLLICRTPEDSEISEVIFKMHPLKAPGPDGFSGIFYRKYWNTVGPEVCKLVKEFFDQGTMSRQINHDAIFYCQASEANATCLMEVFEKYEAWSGQRINKSKSGILFSPNTCDRKKEEIMAIMSMKEKLWVNVLLGKYCSSVNAWVVEKKDQDSLIWKSIIQTRDVCLKGAGVVIANGDTDLWTTPWVPWKSMQEIKDSFSYNRIHAFHKVSNLFVDGTHQWNEGLIRSCFEEDVAKAILNVKPLREGKDQLFWKAAKSGNFSVKSAYWIHQHERFNESNSLWNKIWKIKLHPRLQLLMWKVLNDCVPTFGRLRFLNIQDRTCVFCKEETEDLMHIITRCNIMRGLWFQSRWGLRIDQMGWNTIFAFINWWADIEDHELKVFAACLLDVLWFWRNKIAHNYTPWDMNLLAKEWLSRATEFSVLVQEVEISPLTSSPSHPSHVCRNIPVFQVDASVSDNDSGIAAILNTEGDWNDTLIALDFGMVHSAIEGELSAISVALSTAASKGFHKVAIESDCAVAIQGLQSGCFPVGWGSYPVFMECMSKSREFESVVFSCIKRSSNHYADFLARRARIGKIHVVGSVRDVAPLCGY
uniref:CCHC-type domain-containing protein n=1 Tax=Cannabis sativa TaxID=3483 RepID=A0A803P438_CANSA